MPPPPPLPIGTLVIPSAAAAILSHITDGGMESVRELNVMRRLNLGTLLGHLVLLLDLECIDEDEIVRLHKLDQGECIVTLSLSVRMDAPAGLRIP